MQKTNIDRIRHSLSHLLAMAVLKKFPGVKLGIGPVIENGFYYDFDFVPTRTKEMKSAGLPRSPYGSLAMTDKKTTARNDGMREPQLSDKDLPAIEEEMRRLVKENLVFEGKKVIPAEARKIFKGQPFKLDLIKEFIKEKKDLTVYRTFSPKNEVMTTAEGPKQPRGRRAHDEIAASLPPVAPRNDDAKKDGGDMIEFVDLCKGGHVKNTPEINPDAFQLTHVAGAYWRGDEKNPQLTRIYGVAFETKEELDAHVRLLEEASRRDHKKLGPALDLFTFSDLVGSGLPLWTPKGTLLRDVLDGFVWELRKARGYERVDIPHITKKDLYEKSGHWEKFKEELFNIVTREGHHFTVKPMNCPHHTQIYERRQWSWRELPQRYASTTKVYRDEQSGELAGLSRVRSITQDDAHVFCRQSHIKDEMARIWEIIEIFYRATGFERLDMRLSLRDPEQPEKYLGSAELWNTAEETLRSLVKEKGAAAIEAPGEAAFYGPKVDFLVYDSLGREWQVATIQLDMNQPERFDLYCIDEQGKKERIVMLHAAIMGSLERFIAILIEHYAGAFPLWLSPVQVRILPIADRHLDYAKKTQERLEHEGIRVEMTTPHDTVGKRIRQGELDKIPYLLVIGDQEVENGAVNVRPRKGEQRLEEVTALLKSLKDQLERRASP